MFLRWRENNVKISMGEGCVCAKQALRALGSVRSVPTEEANYVLEITE